MSSTIGAQALFEALLSQGYPMVMYLHDPLLQQTLDYKTVKAAHRRRERGNFPPTTPMGKGTAVMLPDLAVWLASKSAAAQADAPSQGVPAHADLADLPPAPRRRGRPRKGGTR
jgi:hypothetical protein